MDFKHFCQLISVEVSELKRLLETGNVAAAAGNFHGSLEEATELEYLRNILFEYMMGRQPTVNFFFIILI